MIQASAVKILAGENKTETGLKSFPTRERRVRVINVSLPEPDEAWHGCKRVLEGLKCNRAKLATGLKNEGKILISGSTDSGISNQFRSIQWLAKLGEKNWNRFQKCCNYLLKRFRRNCSIKGIW